jgi:hypothetical protein
VISFRYHVVTVAAVFLALAIGVVLGAGPLHGEGDRTLVQQARSERVARSGLQSRVDALQAQSRFTDAFAGTVAPGLLGSTLRGHAVTVVELPSAQHSQVTALENLVGVAGGTVAGTVRIGDKLVDAGSKQLVDELGSQLEGRASGVSVPADAGPYERLGALVGRAVGTRSSGGAPVDAPATSIMSALGTARLLSAQGRMTRRGDLVLLVTGTGRGNADARRGAASIVSTLAQAVDGTTRGVVLAGPPASARPSGEVRAVRDDVTAAKDVSTVDALGGTPGDVVTVLALAGQAAGRAGQYGAVDAADGAMPGAQGGSD